MSWFVVLAFVLTVAHTDADTRTNQLTPTVRMGADRKLNYVADDLGNRVPDFSHCGYAGGDRAVPQVGASVMVEPSIEQNTDDTDRIQRAIDYVSTRPLNADGFRGAVLLGRGKFAVRTQLWIRASGVVLRGMGAGNNGTIIRATGKDRRALIRVDLPRVEADKAKAVLSADNLAEQQESSKFSVTDSFVPVGAKRLRLNSTAGLRKGQRVRVTHPSTKKWIGQLSIDRLGWREGTRDIHWDRTIKSVDSEQIEFDVPLTLSLDSKLSQAHVETVASNRLLQNVGIEDLSLRSDFDDANPLDEEHAWFGVHMQCVRDAWVVNTEFRHFAGGAVMLEDETSRVTVRDCISLAPVSEIAGYRRHTFFTRGQQCLFLRCWSEKGLHDFSVGHCVGGPNAFVNCYAHSALGDSGPLESFATGVLYDNVRIEGNDLSLINRWNSPPKTGWSAVNCVLWQCQAANIRCDRPPIGHNQVIGFWSNPMGDGHFEGSSDFVKPLSLFQQQLKERLSQRSKQLGEEAAKRVGQFLLKPTGATNPSLQQASKFASQSMSPARTLRDLIKVYWGIERLSVESTPTIEDLTEQTKPLDKKIAVANELATKSLRLSNGWLTTNGRLLTGRHYTPLWWRGDMQRQRARAMGAAITRFAPGRYGTGLTDELSKVADHFREQGIVGYDHHYGLWYDRRRDDHLMVKRSDGNVAPPFYEQPFARSGQSANGLAWDSLSRYDLTKFNDWYWQRLRDFASLAERNGFALFHHNYFQHNILEAGAHWADSPWRPANNINDPELPEPPPYVGDKRIFIAESFYDITKPKLRALHRNYIRKSLSNFADQQNVIQLISAEYSGPLHFVEFWIDTIAEWERETGNDVTVALSCPRNVQEAILRDPRRRSIVDIIDIRYWTYTADGKLYAPDGGQHLSPRQHLRQLKPKSTSFESIVRSVRECRMRYPDKAVTYYADIYCRAKRDGWAILMGGGSLPNISKLPTKLAEAVAKMQPSEGLDLPANVWCLAGGDENFLICGSPEQTVTATLKLPSINYEWVLIDKKTSQPIGDFAPLGEKRFAFNLDGKTAIWLKSQPTHPAE